MAGSSTEATSDPFDAIVFAEERAYREAYEEGLLAGKVKAESEGYVTGVLKGASLGQELGFYWGFLLTAKAMYMKNPDKTASRAQKEVNKLLERLEVIGSRPEPVDPTDQAFFDDVEFIRSKFKQVSSLLHVTPSAVPNGPAAATSLAF